MNGNDADVDLGRPEGRALLGHDQVAAERQAERARQHVAVRGADRRLAEPEDRAEQAREALGAEVLVHERDVGGELVERCARREDLLVRRGEHDAAHSLVVAGRLEGRGQLAEQLVGEGVAVVGGVEGDGGDTVVADVVEQRVVRHQSSSTSLPALTTGATVV